MVSTRRGERTNARQLPFKDLPGTTANWGEGESSTEGAALMVEGSECKCREAANFMSAASCSIGWGRGSKFHRGWEQGSNPPFGFRGWRGAVSHPGALEDVPDDRGVLECAVCRRRSEGERELRARAGRGGEHERELCHRGGAGGDEQKRSQPRVERGSGRESQREGQPVGWLQAAVNTHRQPTTWTTFQQDGPYHLGLW